MPDPRISVTDPFGAGLTIPALTLPIITKAETVTATVLNPEKCLNTF